MKAEIIAVGNEIVFGHTVNTNASFLAQHLEEAGIVPRYQTGVCDDEEDIKAAVKLASARTEVIILTGGLGPTADDLTKEAVCSYLNKELVINGEELAKIRAYFEKLGREMPANNEKQAAFPKEAILLANENGTAPGCMIEEAGRLYVLLPGPPREMQPMFLQHVLPYLKTKSMGCSDHLDIHCFGIGESAVALKLQNILGEYEWGSIATYVSAYETVVRLTAHGKDEEVVKALISQYKNKVVSCLRPFIIGYNSEKLEEQVARCLREQNLQIATAESCTGGLVAATLVNCGGISACFKQGIVTYSNEAKEQYLGVSAQTLASKGAVSEETAREMAEGIRQVAGAAIGLSTTGVAGPDGGTPDKPVGLVYVGIALEEDTYVYRLQLNGTRQEVREKTVKHLLFHLYEKLREK